MRFRLLCPLILLVGCGTDLKIQHQSVTAIPVQPPGTRPPVLPLPPQAPTNPPLPAPPHVLLIIEENRSFSAVYPLGMPWLSALGNENGIATNYYSDEGGSLLDYLWLSSGSGEHTFGCGGGGCLVPITSNNIFRMLNKAGMSWKVYAESLPYSGYMKAYGGTNCPPQCPYYKRHNPAPWYEDIITSKAQQSRMVPFSQFAKDVAAKQLPVYSVIIPNAYNDAHNGTPAMADDWLRKNIGPLLASSYFQPGDDGTLFITFDNGDADAQGHVFTAVVGPRVKRGVKVNTAFRHENLLRTVIDMLGMKDFPGATATAAPMKEFFK